MVYKVIGTMSGSSLDGLDIAYMHLTFSGGKWGYELIAADCLAYEDDLREELRNAPELSGRALTALHSRYGHYLGESVAGFVARHDLHHRVDFIASHGHTVFHYPKEKTTCQIGDGAAIAAATGLPVISDLRAMDVALGGQGAPIVPIGDRLLFGDYPILLNLGGIANITIRNGEQILAFDVCPANRLLNPLAARAGLDYDDGGALAGNGALSFDLLIALNRQAYYRREAPKSLGNDEADALAAPALADAALSMEDLLHTACAHIAEQIGGALHDHYSQEAGTMLITGGGAFNSWLVEAIRREAAHKSVGIVIPEPQTILYKEAIVMGLLGALRWREEVNVLASVTGASRDSVGGALWLPS